MMPSIWSANTTVSFGVAAHAAGIIEVNGNAVADAIKARLFNMCSLRVPRHLSEMPPVARPFGGLKLRVTVLGKVAQRLPRPVLLRSAARRLTGAGTPEQRRNEQEAAGTVCASP